MSRSEQGFSLLEVLAALVIGTGMILAVMQAYGALTRRMERVGEEALVARMERSFLDGCARAADEGRRHLANGWDLAWSSRVMGPDQAPERWQGLRLRMLWVSYRFLPPGGRGRVHEGSWRYLRVLPPAGEGG